MKFFHSCDLKKAMPFRSLLSLGLIGMAGVLSSSLSYSAESVKPLTTENLLKDKPSAVPYFDISNYLTQYSSGLIQAEPLESGKSLSFRVNAFEQSLETTTVEDADAMIDRYTFDEETFIKNSNLPDFLQAKTAYYKALSFNDKTQAYERKYLYPEDWKDLFFPPRHELTLPYQRYDQRFVDRSNLPKDSAYYSADWHKSIDAKTQTHLTFGNQLDILSNGLALQKKIELSKKAKKSIFVGVMSFLCDDNSLELFNTLADRVKDGVDVRIMMEGLWTDLAFEKCASKMRKAGMEVILSTDMATPFKPMILFHNKFWIFDNQEAILGGENIVNSDGASTGFNHKNRDVDVHVVGPAVTDIMQAFADLYDRFSKFPIRARPFRGITDLRAAIAERVKNETAVTGPENYDRLLGSPDTRSKGVCRFVIQGPQAASRYTISQTYAEYINQAKQSLFLTSPSIDFQEGNDIKKINGSTLIWNAVQDRAKNGVSVDVITNGIDGEDGETGAKLRDLANHEQALGHQARADEIRKMSLKSGKGAARSGRHFLEVLALNPTVRPWDFFNYYHGKTIFFDRTALAIGSYNLDTYSAEHSHESTLICQDDNLIAQEETLSLQDLVNSVPVFVESNNKAPFPPVHPIPQSTNQVDGPLNPPAEPAVSPSPSKIPAPVALQ